MKRCKISSHMFQYCCTLKQIGKCLIVSTRTAAVNLSFKIAGDPHDQDKAPIILLHGFLENKKCWRGLSKIMLNTMKRSVITVDMRNHGRSPHAPSHKYEDMVADILKLYEKLKINQACLIGYSIGGKAAMCLSLLSPEKVAALIVVEGSPITVAPEFVETFPKILAAMKTVDFDNTKTVRNGMKRAKEHLRETIQDDATLAYVVSNVIIRPDNTIGWACNLDVLTKYFNHVISFPKNLKGKRYKGPVLFIGGLLSEYIPPDDLTGIRGYFPYAVIQYIPNAGHNVKKDDPKSFLEMIITFLRNAP